MSKSNTKSNELYLMFTDFIQGLERNNCQLVIDACNDFTLPRDWSFSNRVNSNYHIAYIRRGSGHYLHHNIKDKMVPHKLYFFTSGCCHSRFLDTNDLPHMVLLRFSIIGTNGDSYHPITPFSFSLQTDPTGIGTLLDRLVLTSHATTHDYSDKIIHLLLLQLLYELTPLLNETDKGCRHDYRITKTMDYIRQHFYECITIDQLSHMAGLSKNYYRKLFREQTGQLPKTYMINIRMEQAKHLLLETSYTVKEIAELLGYPDAYSFSKQFKEKTCYAPITYRHHIDRNLK